MKPCLLPEWAPQFATLLVWPHEKTDWAPFLKEVEPVYCAIVSAISDHQMVMILCYDEAHQKHIQHQLLPFTQSSHIQFFVSPYNDTWIRDYGPLSVLTHQGTQWLKFNFNAWGQKYSAELDNDMVHKLVRFDPLLKGYNNQPPQLIMSALTLEGGGLETDGVGTLLTTSQCALSPQRMPNATKASVEAQLMDLLDLKRVLWLDYGQLPGDDTDGHIDTLVRFCSPTLLCYQTCDDKTANCYLPLQRMEQQLKTFNQLDGKLYQWAMLPWPNIEKYHKIFGLPATYANFLITNKKVLVPIYHVPADQQALATLTQCFPHHQIEGIYCLPLIKQYGSLHCATMQLTQGL